MKPLHVLSIIAVLGCLSFAAPSEAKAAGRHYYSSWGYHPQKSYHYTYYYYKPRVSYSGYQHHYCIYYPSRPRYVYYYNPHRRVYWGRYDLEAKGYSLLEDADRKPNLSDIPESAFPKPGGMPNIPESEDGVAMPPPPAVPKG